VVLGPLEVRDTLTGLVWRQQSSTVRMTWDGANTYCSSLGSGFRLPTVKELLSLVDHTVASGPKINQTAFPDTQASDYWTSTPYYPSGGPWIVDFGDGQSMLSNGVTDYWVRCVR